MYSRNSRCILEMYSRIFSCILERRESNCLLFLYKQRKLLLFKENKLSLQYHSTSPPRVEFRGSDGGDGGKVLGLLSFQIKYRDELKCPVIFLSTQLTVSNVVNDLSKEVD